MRYFKLPDKQEINVERTVSRKIHKIFMEKVQIVLDFSSIVGYYIAVSTQTE